MTYHEITEKLKDLTMEPSDWKWLEEYMCNPKHDNKFHEWTPEYRDIVKAYRAREEGKRPVCHTYFGTCRYCGYGFKCGYSGFCNKQRAAI